MLVRELCIETKTIPCVCSVNAGAGGDAVGPLLVAGDTRQLS